MEKTRIPFRYIFTTILLLKVIVLQGQNLVANGNCDTYTTLPSTYGQVCYGTGWTSPSGTCSVIVGTGSPDYYNTNGSGGAKPPATFWSNVMPHSGTGMEGFAGYYTSSGAPYREYIQYHLSAPMVPGVSYQVSYFITNGITTFHGYGCNHIGVYFSTAAVTQTGGTNMPYIPQLEDTSVFFSTSWVQKTFTFTPAVAYSYITIGNFYNNITTTIQQFVNPSTVTGAYYYIDDVVIQPATILPVELLSFTGIRKGNENLIQWTTGSEINNHYFSVERSSNGKQFSEIGRVEGHGTTSNFNEYTFIDDGFISSINYYRLRQVDFDGAYRFSGLVEIRNEHKALNPAWYSEADLAIYFTDENISGSYEIVSLTGQIVLKGEFHHAARGKLDVKSLQPGIYIMRWIGLVPGACRFIVN